MSCCELDYIPDRLKSTETSPSYNEFAVNDILYRRVTDLQLENPYGTIKFADLSHNIGTNLGKEVSKSKDVLYSILEDEDFEMYEGKIPLELKVVSLDDEGNYNKVFTCDKNEGKVVRVKLLHTPECCMHPHCVFQFFIIDSDGNEIEVTFDDYKKTLGSNSFKFLRDKLRHEFSLMIVRKEISFEDLD